MAFKKYMHIERFGNDEVQGIELGQCYVFPKLDGTNASVWLNENGAIKTGSRRRELKTNDDNAGFCNWVIKEQIDKFINFFYRYPYLRLYGEWLVPHSLRTYNDDAWRKFYIFDVWMEAWCENEDHSHYLSYNEYQPVMEEFGFNYIPPLSIVNNATYDKLLVELKNNGYLIQDGKGCGEGIVIKNYQYQNKFGRTVWAKIVTNEFKTKNTKAMGATIKNFKEMVETVIVNKYITQHLIDKNYSKIVTEMEGWNSKYIPRLFGTVWYDLINEELWNIIKIMKQPTINFKTLYQLVVLKVKELKPELF